HAEPVWSGSEVRRVVVAGGTGLRDRGGSGRGIGNRHRCIGHHSTGGIGDAATQGRTILLRHCSGAEHQYAEQSSHGKMFHGGTPEINLGVLAFSSENEITKCFWQT